MKRRRVLVTIDTIVEMMKDYVGEEDVPADAVALKMMINPTERRRVGIVLQSAQVPASAAPIVANFQISRIFSAA